MLGIIGAMEVEVEKLRAKMTETEMKTVAGMNFCKGKLEGKDVVIVRSGIGKVNARTSAPSKDALPAVTSLLTVRKRKNGSVTHLTRTAQRWKAQLLHRRHT